MRKLYLILLFLPIFGFGSCVKQKNCDCCKDYEVVGLFQYLEEPIDILISSNQTAQVIAILYSEDGFEYRIAGNVPKKYKPDSLVKIRACCQPFPKAGNALFEVVYKLTCIEKEDKL